MTLDAIIASFQEGTLADQSDLVLHDAQIKVALWHDWRLTNPEAKPDAVPPAPFLRRVYDSLETLANRRYGCND